jgi:hypothetical protein
MASRATSVSPGAGSQACAALTTRMRPRARWRGPGGAKPRYDTDRKVLYTLLGVKLTVTPALTARFGKPELSSL